jgi:hypothetical protein
MRVPRDPRRRERQSAVELVAGADGELGEDFVQVVLDNARAMKSWAAISGLVKPSLTRAGMVLADPGKVGGFGARPDSRIHSSGAA